MAQVPAMRSRGRHVKTFKPRASKVTVDASRSYEEVQRFDPRPQILLPGDQPVKRINWTLIGAVASSVIFFAIMAVAIGFAIGAKDAGNPAMVERLVETVESMSLEMSEMRAQENERLERQEIRQEKRNAEQAKMFKTMLGLFSVVIVLGLCAYAGGMPGLLFGIVALAFGFAFFNGTIQIK